MTSKTESDAPIRVCSSLRDILRSDWDACANPGRGEARASSGDGAIAIAANGLGASAADCGDQSPRAATAPANNPFVSHDFLWSLEESGAATRKTGWLGQHLVLDGADGRPAAILPCYLKSHSMGEYVFDHGWADAFERAGGRYYPKLQASVPFTPVTGPAPARPAGAGCRAPRQALAAGAVAPRRQARCLVAARDLRDRRRMPTCSASAGFLRRTDQQFHFVNEGYRDFDDFLAALASRKRKAIRRERRDALAGGIEVEHLTGSEPDRGGVGRVLRLLHGHRLAEMGPALSQPPLLLADRRAHGGPHPPRHGAARTDATSPGRSTSSAPTRSTAAIGARSRNSPSCISSSATTRRSNGRSRIGLPRVEAGAQGEHKLARGYRPTTTYSAHWIADPVVPPRRRRLSRPRAAPGRA